MLYQLSYSRTSFTDRSTAAVHLTETSRCRFAGSNICFPRRPSGGEGNRTPDLLNAIQALSQLSYAPGPAQRESSRMVPTGTANNSRGYM